MKSETSDEEALKIAAICFVCMLLSLFFGACVSLRLYSTESELGAARTELEYVTEYNNSITARAEQLQSGIDRCAELTAEAKRTIGETGTTIAEIRKEIENLENYVFNIECELADIRNNSYSNEIEDKKEF